MGVFISEQKRIRSEKMKPFTLFVLMGVGVRWGYLFQNKRELDH